MNAKSAGGGRKNGGTIPRRVGEALTADHKPIVWISAPTGSGKSIFAMQMCRQSGDSIVWLRAEPRMADMGVFLTSLEAAFRKAFPKADLPALASQDIAFPEDYLRRLIFSGPGDSRVTVVFDDLHVLPTDAPVHQALADAVREDVGSVRLILISREPQHPAWLRFNAIGKAALVNFDMLKLNEAEANELIAGGSDGCNGWTGADLIRACGGWMLGACLLMQAQKAPEIHSSADQLAHESKDFLDLIVHELVEPLPEGDRIILCRAARLPNLPAKIVAHALELPRNGGRLTELANKLLFVERDGRDRLQIHDLLKAALLHRYSDLVHDREVAELGARAGQALLDDGDVSEGLLLLSAYGAWDTLRGAIVEHAPALGEQGEFGVILAALGPMPQAECEKDMRVCYWFGMSLINVNPGRASEILMAALDVVLRAREQEILIPIWTGLVDAIWFKWSGFERYDDLIAMLPKLSKLAQKLGAPHEAALARGAFVAMMMRCPDHPDFPFWEQRNLDFYFQNLPRHETVRRGIQMLSRYCYGEGHRWKATQVRTRLNQVFDEEIVPAVDICTRHYVDAEFLSIFEASGDETFFAVESGLEANATYQQQFLDGALLNAGLFKALTLEDRERSRRYLELLFLRLGSQPAPAYIAFHQYFSAWHHWLDGENDAAFTLVTGAYRAGEQIGMALFPALYGSAVATVLQSLGRRREALVWLRRTRRAAEQHNSPLLIFLTGLRCAALAMMSADPERAKPYLRKALKAGAAMRFYLHAWTSRAEMAALMRFAVLNDIEADYANELIRVLGLAGHMPSKANAADVQIVSLGRFDVLKDGVSQLTSGKLPRSPIALAVHLIAAGPEGNSSESLADRLWPDLATSEALKRMKSTVYRLRQMIGAREAVITQGGRIALDPEYVSIDAWDLATLVSAPGWTAEARYAEALRLYRGAFVYHYADDTGLIAFEHKLEDAAIQACVAFAHSLSLAGDWSRALRVAREGLERIGFHDTLYELAEGAAEHLGIELDADTFLT